jgi:hypothetical protein
MDWRRVLRTIIPHASLWEAVLPAKALGLPSELTTVEWLPDAAAHPQAPLRARLRAAEPRGGRIEGADGIVLDHNDHGPHPA